MENIKLTLMGEGRDPVVFVADDRIPARTKMTQQVTK